MQDRKMDYNRVILNFTHAYERQDFYRGKRFELIDLTVMEGVDCYCSDESELELTKRFRDFGPEGIHFLDSGNYHYASKLWTDLIKEPFELLVFDHHSDMQPPAFGEILTCGDWVRWALRECKYLKKVWLAGPPGRELRQLSEEYGERLTVLCGEEIERLEREGCLCQAWGSRGESVEQGQKLPIYLSIDKDILGTDCARTNWDQGTCSIDTLRKLTNPLLGETSGRRLIGADICGELPDADSEDDQGRLLNNRSNGELLELVEGLFHGGAGADHSG